MTGDSMPKPLNPSEGDRVKKTMTTQRRRWGWPPWSFLGAPLRSGGWLGVRTAAP